LSYTECGRASLHHLGITIATAKGARPFLEVRTAQRPAVRGPADVQEGNELDRIAGPARAQRIGNKTMPNNFVVNAADLAYILRQIKIAEASSIGYTPDVAPVSILQAIMNEYGANASNAALLPAGLRTVDGTYNNLVIGPNGTDPGTSEYGAADTLFPRLTDPVFRNEGDDAMSFGPGAPTITNNNYAGSGDVADADPRIISNLIVDMSVNNPAAITAFINNPLSSGAFEEEMGYAPTMGWFTDPANIVAGNEWLQSIPNQSPDIGLSPGFNSWMTFFGQFFDHGLDLVTKGNAGTVYIPLAGDDPLIAGADGVLNDDPNTAVNEAADNLPPHLRFMALSRATQTVDANGIPQHENTTTSWIDQNQTYTSHSSHQVFLREYARDAAGHAVSTGRLLDGTTAGGSVDGAVANWGEVKAQAKEMLGIILGDFDVHNAPLLLTDQYGKFIPGANGYAQLVMAPDATHATNWLKEGTAAGITTEGSIGTGHAFLNDIAHHAAPAIVDLDHNGVPETRQTADLDIQDVNRDGRITQVDIDADNKDVNRDGVVNAADKVADDGVESTYDDEMLNAHFITGDGRGNENIALTTVHSIFHSEHNRVVEANKATILNAAYAGDLAFLNEWLIEDVTEIPSDPSTLVWDGERLFQAARFSTEMQYQHLVFEEFARRIQPFVDPFVFNNSPNIDPSIVAEFAHTVYRFGHSMLTGTVDRLENDLSTVNGDPDQKALLAVFLNPQAYIATGTSLEEINADVIRGLSRDVGNAMDEFIVTDVRSNLLGLPLDLGALNIARGRDTGIPSLNETRRQLYEDSGLADLKPYENWVDFAANLKNASSVVNFIAAYGTHPTITAATTMAAKRAAADKIVFGGDGAPSDRLDFVYATGAYAPDGSGPHDDSRGGLELIDLWIGGLAEASPEFGGMLGTTFNYVFEAQMENLQNGDRMYYLTRTQGQNLIHQLESNTFADLVMRNTDLGDQYSTHLNGQLFTTPDLFLELDRGIAQTDYNGSASGLDPDWADGEPHSPFNQKVTRTYSGVTDENGHDFGGTMRYIGGQHAVMGGTEGNDKLYGDRGIDTLWGDGGDDYLNAGTESDEVFGGLGDDIIEDPFGDDFLRGNEGNDVIASARGADILFGNQGKDAIFIGQDASEVFAGEGNDFVLGGSGGDVINGNEGDDWLEGGAGFDTLTGDNSELFFNSKIIGHDVMFAHADESDYDAESGDDIMGSGPSVYRYEGMFGFDWGIGKGDIGGVQFNLLQGIFTNVADDILRDRFDKVEALSGFKYDDLLEGDHRGHIIPGTAVTGLTVDATFNEDLLTQEGIDRIDGFGNWFGNVRQTLFGPNGIVPGTEVATSFRDGNILLGGDGNDTIRGRGGFDLIDGDAYLNVRILITTGSGQNVKYYSAESLNTDTTAAGPYAGRVYAMKDNDPQGDVDFASGPAFDGRSVSSLLLDRTINPAQMSIVREIKYDATDLTGASQNYDTAVFNGTLAEYDIEGRTVDSNGIQLTAASDVNDDGFISVHDRDDGVTGATVTINGVTTTLNSRGPIFVDDTDFIKNIEELRFADQTLVLSGPHMPKPPEIDLHAFDLVTTTTQYRDTFTSPAFDNSNGTTPWNTSWVEINDGANAVGAGQIQIDGGNSNQLRFLGGTTAANDGASITRAVNLTGLGSATLTFDYGFANIDTGERLFVEFARDGVNFINIGTIDGGATSLNATVAGVSQTFTTTVLGGNSAALLRFTSTSLNAADEMFRVDNVNFAATTTAQVAANDGSGFASSFTEGGAAAAIARNAVITDPDSANMIRATIRLTNAQSEDLLSIAGALPAGITSSFGPVVAGQITLILSGSASLAAYQTAIQQVRYSSTSQNPATTPRTIEVSVNDGQASSPVTIATVNVVAVNDAPVAIADTVITNIVSGNIVIAESVLLGNDTDAEGNTLDVTAVSAAAGVTGLSLATNAGSVTLADDATPGGSFTYTASDGALSSNASVTLVNRAFTNVADNFNGAGAVRSAANNSTGTVAWTTSWTELADTNNLQTGQIQIDGGGGNGTNQLRVVNGDGGSVTRTVNLAGASNAILTFDFDKNGIDSGESVQVQFAADGVNFVNVAGGLITNTNGTTANGNAAGTLSLALTGALGANSAIRFVGSAISAVGEDIRIDNLRIDYAAANADLTGTANGEILIGNDSGSTINALGGDDRIVGGGGNDTINAGGGNDTIIWSVGDGRDIVNGGANGAVGDRFVVNGNDTVENFVVYARAEALAAGITGLDAATEIVVTRNGNVIGELANVEEITINTAGGADNVSAVGDFNPTSLFFNTVTVNGGPNTTIDASQLTSAHHLVLNQNGTTAAAQPGASDSFPGVGQSLIDALDRKGLLDTGDTQGFVGSRHNGSLMAALLGEDHAGGRHFYEMTHGLDFAPSDLADSTSGQAQALHFDAADHLIS
jgi:Ca2+-binding RTX toxin-like protein